MHRMAQYSYSQLLHYGLFYDYRNPYFIWGLNWIYFPPLVLFFACLRHGHAADAELHTSSCCLFQALNCPGNKVSEHL